MTQTASNYQYTGVLLTHTCCNSFVTEICVIDYDADHSFSCIHLLRFSVQTDLCPGTPEKKTAKCEDCESADAFTPHKTNHFKHVLNTVLS